MSDLEKAIEMLREMYAEAAESNFIEKPIA